MFERKIQDIDEIYKLVDGLTEITPREKQLIRLRFTRIGRYINDNFNSVSTYYNYSKVFMLVAGIVNPALLSVEYGNQNAYIFWTVWGLQLSVTILTGLMAFYKWDKKYFLYYGYRNRIFQEIWLYLELTGHYHTVDQDHPIESITQRTTHQTKLSLFLTRLESLYRKLRDSALDLEIQEDDDKKKTAPSSTNVQQVPSHPASLSEFASRVISPSSSIREPERSIDQGEIYREEEILGGGDTVIEIATPVTPLNHTE